MPLDMASLDASSASMESTVRVLVSFFLATDETSSARSTGATHKEKFNVPLSEDHKDLFKFQKYLKTFTGLRYCKHDQWSTGNHCRENSYLIKSFGEWSRETG